MEINRVIHAGRGLVVPGFSPANLLLGGWALERAFRRSSDKQIESVTRRLTRKRPARKDKKSFIFCRNCGHIVSSTDQRVEINGAHTHTFRNPAGIVYRIGCFGLAPGCLNFGDPTEEFSWFPGYTWVYANCLNCFNHLGWFYQSGERHFHGLILNHLTFEGPKKDIDNH